MGTFVCAQLLLLDPPGRAQQAGGAAPQPILPAAPADLLACLPPTPLGWTMTRSNAASSFNVWLVTTANRELKQNPPPVDPSATPTTPFVPGLLSAHLSDGGYSTNYVAGFVAPASGAARGITFLKIGQYPARKYKPDDVTETVSVLVKGRFVIEMRGKNMPEQDLLDYLSRVNYQRLLAISDIGQHEIPQPVMITRVDEIDPKQNRTYPLYWAKPQQR